MAAKISAADYNALNPVVRANPYPYYAALREESPIHRMIRMFNTFCTVPSNFPRLPFKHYSRAA